jgi:NADH:ubiquinone reductase (H+-translocating)
MSDAGRHRVLHLTFLTGFKNRFFALAQWFLAFLGRARNERTITLQQATARVVAMGAGIDPTKGDLTPPSS